MHPSAQHIIFTDRKHQDYRFRSCGVSRCRETL